MLNNIVWLNELKEDMKLLKMDGVPNIVRSQALIVRLVWSLFLVAFVCVCVALIVGSVNEYLHYEVTTKSRVYQEKAPILPTITICPINQFGTDQATALMLAANVSDMLSLELYTHNRTGAYLSDAAKQSLSNLDLILVDCLIGSDVCNSSHFQWVWHPSKYNCYRFNSGYDWSSRNKRDLLRINIPGHLNYRFQLNLYTGLPNYWSARTLSTRGFYLYIHNSTEYPFDVSASPILLTPGFGLMVNVDRTFYSQFNEWPYAYSECRVSADGELLGSTSSEQLSLVEQVKALNYTYSRSTCLLLCAQQITAAKCGCINYGIGMRLLAEEEWCLTDGQQACANRQYADTFAESSNEEECTAKCPLECEQRTLTPTLSFFQYPAYSEAQYLRFFGDPEFISNHMNQTDFSSMANFYKNLLSVTIFYEALEYSLVEEKARLPLESLIATIGGHLHLFLGMSVISFFEIAELIATALKYHFLRPKKGKNSETQ